MTTRISGDTGIDKVESSTLASILPTGVITLWSGAKTAIPAGWALCDGLNGTPNLQDKFVVGAGSTYAVGATGGTTSASLSVSGSTSSVGDHYHGMGGGTSSNGNQYYYSSGSQATTSGMAISSSTFTSSCYGSTYSYTGPSLTSNGGGHSHTFSGSGSVATLPPYYALCYIMKL